MNVKEMTVGAAASIVSLAMSAGMTTARAENYYVDLHVGYNIVDNGNLEYDAGNVSAGYEQRPAFGGSFGYHDESGFRVEAELTHRYNDINYFDAVYVKGELTSLSLMVNAIYELEIGGDSYGYGLGSDNPLRPYIGLGLGGSRLTMEATDNLAGPAVIDDTTYAFAYQGIVGFGVAVTETAMLTMDFRYLVADNIQFDDEAGTAFEIDAIQATAMLGLRTKF